jgi:hypothetical protein
MSYEELKGLLNHKGKGNFENPKTPEIFKKNSSEIQDDLEDFLKKEKILESFNTYYKKLQENFTLENYRNFLQCAIPRIKYFKLHVGYAGARFSGITGLKSLSVGAPVQPPYNPLEKRVEFKEGLPVVEFSIPSDQVIVHPLFKSMAIEMEKEINTLDIRSEWIVDVYNGTDDFAERFVKDKSSVLYPMFESKKDGYHMGYIYDRDIWDILQSWKHTESIADLIPNSKLEEIDENNPILQKPLLE